MLLIYVSYHKGERELSVLNLINFYILSRFSPCALKFALCKKQHRILLLNEMLKKTFKLT